MSLITEQIKSYRAGSIDFDALITKLTKRTYPPPERMVGAPSNLFARATWLDEQPGYTDGTWDEVLRARSFGLLTPEEYDEINKARKVATKDAENIDSKLARLGNMMVEIAKQDL